MNRIQLLREAWAILKRNPVLWSVTLISLAIDAVVSWLVILAPPEAVILRSLLAFGLAAFMTGALINVVNLIADGQPVTLIEGVQAGLRRLFPLLKDSQSKLEHELYTVCGVKDSIHTARWRSIMIASMVVPVIMAILTVICDVLAHQTEIIVLVVAPSIVAAVSFFLVESAAMPFMPDAFFLHEPLGRNVLQFSGASTPAGARIVCGIVSIVCTAIIAATIVVPFFFD